MSATIGTGAPLSSASPNNSDKISRNISTPNKRLPNVDPSKVDPQLKIAAEGMEAMFLDYLMQVMRQTVPKNDMDLQSPATQIYQGMLDSETAKKAAKTGGIGLADQIVAYMQSTRYNLSRNPPAPPGAQAEAPMKEAGTGGTHEGEPKLESER